MTSAVIKLCAILMFVAVCAADVSELGLSPNAPPPVTEVCLGCMCQASSGCKLNIGCQSGTCGLFRITEPYWIDGGRLTINGDNIESSIAYQNCANDPLCASFTVQGYMKRYAKDCNGDGRVDCYDYMAIHKNGPYGCDGELANDYINVFNQCVAAVAAQKGSRRYQ